MGILYFPDCELECNSTHFLQRENCDVYYCNEMNSVQVGQNMLMVLTIFKTYSFSNTVWNRINAVFISPYGMILVAC